MAFDLFPRSNKADLISPFHTHPKSVATSTALSRTLDGAYAHAQQHGRLLFSQLWPQNMLDPAAMQAVQWLNATSAQTIYQVDRRIPDQVTRIVCMARFRIGAGTSTPAWNPETNHRITIANGTYTDTGNLTTVSHPPIPWNANGPRFDISLIDPFRNTFQVGFFVTLVNSIDANGNVRAPNPYTITITAYADNDKGGSSCAYSPVSLVGWYEVN